MRADSRRKRYNDAFDTVTDATVARAPIGLAIRAGKPRVADRSRIRRQARVIAKKRRPDRDAAGARGPNPHATARGPGER